MVRGLHHTADMPPPKPGFGESLLEGLLRAIVAELLQGVVRTNPTIDRNGIKEQDLK